MGDIDQIQLNQGGVIKLGSVTEWNSPQWSNRYLPISQQRPSRLTPYNYKNIVDTYVNFTNNIDNLLGRTFDSPEDIGDYLDSTNLRYNLEHNALFLVGNPEDGGLALLNNGGTTSCMMLVWSPYWYDSEREQYFIHIANLTVPYMMRESGGAAPAIDRPTSIVFFNKYFNPPDTTQIIRDGGQYGAAFYMTSLPTWYYGTDAIDPDSQSLTPQWIQTEYTEVTTWEIYLQNWTKNYTQKREIWNNMNHPWEQWLQFKTPITGMFYFDLEETATRRRESGLPLGGGLIDEEGNPYGGVSSDSDGGDGDHSLISDNIGNGGLPSSGILTSGICRIYLPDTSQIGDFVNFLYNTFSDQQSNKIKKLYANPIESILAFNVCHLNIAYSGTADITFAGVNSQVNVPYAANQFHMIRYSLNLDEFWGSFLDYSSYTKLKIYVPYCGIYELNVDDFMSGQMFLEYKVDILSGMCVVMLTANKIQKSGVSLNSVLYQFNGNIFESVPISATDWRGYYQSLLQIASVGVNVNPSNVGNSVLSLANAAISQKISVQKAGSIGSNFGYMGIQTPYLIIERPVVSMPYEFGKHFGYMSNITMRLGDCEGFTQIDTTQGFITDDINGITQEEADELKSLLASGVYF